MAEQNPIPGSPNPKGAIHFPNKEPAKVTTGHVFGFIGFGLFCMCFIIGLFVEYTSLFGTQLNYTPDMSDAQKDKALVNSKGLLGKIFLSFSPSRNLKKMFYSPQKDDDYLTVLNGIRVISMYFVILGHAAGIMVNGGATNIVDTFSIISTWWVILIGTGFYSVDTFFFLSAFLATYLMIGKFYGKRMFNIPMIYLHRLIRVWPTILLLTLFIITFFVFMGSGPVWLPFAEREAANCRESWWVNLLFITSWYHSAPCISQLWYLANEMTFFIFVPLIVLAYLNSKMIGYLIVGFANVISIILPFIFSHVRGHGISILVTPAQEYVPEIYNYPYTRTGSYFVGVLFGILYFEWNKSRTDPSYQVTIGAKIYNTIKNSTVLCYICIVMGGLVMLFFILFPRIELKDISQRTIGQIPSDFFNAFHRSLFVTGMATFLAPMMIGRMTLLKDLFGGKLWAPWAKVTFMSFLIHIHVLGWFFAKSKASIYIDGPANIFGSLATFLVTVLVSIPFALMFESPILQFERLVLFPPKARPALVKEELLEKYQINETDESELTRDDKEFPHKMH
uniref:Acyltransferase 3 domain-containing protein n=1 Tax=Euplotes crassus TaxID=5936 RepID=A0A7S3KB49_EUPCR|mmetsp:Transcript_1554/g.1514  ORF Transcript_1554/g.1514 Transcript_1554/m.1514 type:complete len:564 (+) Transcript_1554:290-1981(+)